MNPASRVLPVLLLATPAFAWQSPEFPAFNEVSPKVFQAKANLKKGVYPLQFEHQGQCFTLSAPLKLNQAISLEPCNNSPISHRLFRDGNYLAELDLRSGTPTLTLKVEAQADPQAWLKSCPKWDGKPLDIEVGKLFAEGESVRDFYSGKVDIVKNGKVRFSPDPKSNGLILLEKATDKAVKKAEKSAFDWQNATVYFVLTDRFYNGDPANDQSYGRQKDGMQEIGTFHGGDLKGLTAKLDYLQDLGVNAIWISSPLEQIRGWVGGGEKGDFPHYAYHGYYHQDWTKIDQNMGTEADLAEFVKQAHQRGMRVLFDVVLNHTGYATLADMQAFGFGSLYLNEQEKAEILGKNWTDWKPKAGQNWHSFNDFINFNDKAGWQKWWGKEWVRSDLGDYDSPKFDDLQMSLASLPDLKTESDKAVKIPTFFANKNTNAENRENAKVRDYLIGWLSAWVEKYGIDGFRVDTAKHVEKATWAALKRSASEALKRWQAKNPQAFGEDFWMTGEAWGHTVVKSDYYQNGFDAMINFSFQDQAKAALDCFAHIVPTYQQMSDKLNGEQGFNLLSYLSSHDTRLFFHSDSQNDLNKQKTAANLLLLSPAAVQIYYGDESGRRFGATGSDPIQGTRSDMNWQDLKQADHQQLLAHWQKVAAFRQQHLAVGKGSQTLLETQKYVAFSRQMEEDKVLIIWAGSAE